jgi:transketolase
MDFQLLQKKAAQIRLDTLTAIHKSGEGYSGSCMSVVDILTTLYYGGVMRVDPAKPQWEDQDYLIMAKAHAAAAQYAILADKGFIDESEMNHLGASGSNIGHRPNMKVPGVTATISAHGYGLSIATGLAMSLKMDRKANRVFSIIGDGELQQGAVWEACMSAAHYNLNNLILFVDNDDLQMSGSVRAVMDVNPIQDKFEAFGWKVIQVMDGHDIDQLLTAISRAFTSNRQPVCIWCHTVKGKGIDFAEGNLSHNAALSEAELNEVRKNLINKHGELEGSI